MFKVSVQDRNSVLNAKDKKAAVTSVITYHVTNGMMNCAIFSMSLCVIASLIVLMFEPPFLGLTPVTFGITAASCYIGLVVYIVMLKTYFKNKLLKLAVV